LLADGAPHSRLVQCLFCWLLITFSAKFFLRLSHAQQPSPFIIRFPLLFSSFRFLNRHGAWFAAPRRIHFAVTTEYSRQVPGSLRRHGHHHSSFFGSVTQYHLYRASVHSTQWLYNKCDPESSASCTREKQIRKPNHASKGVTETRKLDDPSTWRRPKQHTHGEDHHQKRPREALPSWHRP